MHVIPAQGRYDDCLLDAGIHQHDEKDTTADTTTSKSHPAPVSQPHSGYQDSFVTIQQHNVCHFGYEHNQPSPLHH